MALYLGLLNVKLLEVSWKGFASFVPPAHSEKQALIPAVVPHLWHAVRFCRHRSLDKFITSRHCRLHNDGSVSIALQETMPRFPVSSWSTLVSDPQLSARVVQNDSTACDWVDPITQGLRLLSVRGNHSVCPVPNSIFCCSSGFCFISQNCLFQMSGSFALVIYLPILASVAYESSQLLQNGWEESKSHWTDGWLWSTNNRLKRAKPDNWTLKNPSGNAIISMNE